MDSPPRECEVGFSAIRAIFLLSLPLVSISDIGSSASNFRGPMSAYNPYPTYPTYPTYPSYSRYPRRYYGSYGAPSTAMSYYPSAYSGYAPSATYSTYSDARYSSTAYNTGGSTERTYFSYNGKLVRSYKIRSFRVGLWASLHRPRYRLISLPESPETRP
jgi:hypothetical protein